MIICPNCRVGQPSDDTRVCVECGYILKPGNPNDPANTDSEETAHESNVPEQATLQDDDDLGIESTSYLMEQEALNGKPAGSDYSDEDLARDSSGNMLPMENELNGSMAAGAGPDTNPDNEELTATGKFKRLSDEDVKKIEENLYKKSTFISEEEKSELLKKVEEAQNKPFSNTPIDPSALKNSSPNEEPNKESQPQPVLSPVGISPVQSRSEHTTDDIRDPVMAKRSRGIALFYKNFIQLQGNQQLYAGDTLEIGGRQYTLKPKKLKPTYVYVAAGTVFALLLILVGSLFIADVGGEGRIVGFVLDEYSRPGIADAQVRFPELGKSAQTNGQGFFTIDAVPAGSHKIEYVVDGQVVFVDYATIVDGGLNTVLLSSEANEEYTASSLTEEYSSVAQQETYATPSQPVAKTEPKVETPKQITAKSTQPPSTTKDSRSKTKSTVAAKSTPQYSKVTLAANVQSARLKIDGNVVGAGNITYSQIKPGSHSYEVSADGYRPVEGSFYVDAGDTKTLSVSLSPLTTTEKKKSFDADAFYNSGLTAYKANDLERAIEDLSRAIEQDPSNALAYYYRAESYSALLKNTRAHDDYIRAAEIFKVRRDFNEAITSYNKAVDLDSKSITAYLGRANAYLIKGEELAAIADYDKVIYLDRRNFRAYYGMGEARFKLGQYRQAIDHFKDARSVDDNNPLVHQYLTLCYMATSDYKNVKKSFEKFGEVASEKDKQRFEQNDQFSAIQKIVDSY